MREEGRSDEEIHRMNTKVRRNKIMRQDQSCNYAKIIWGADDPEIYHFFLCKREDDGAKQYTVYSYFKERYNITLKFPKMPIVFLGNNEWFPIEFLSQSFGKMRAANSPDQVKAVLDYYNKHAGTNYVGNVSDMAHAASRRLGDMGLNINDVLQQYNLRKAEEPIKLEARVLPEPTLKFAEYDAFLKDGDWAVMKGGRGIRFNK